MMKAEIIKELRGLADGSIKPVDKRFGACFQIYERVYIRLGNFVDFAKYPRFSGDEEFPVAHPDKSPIYAYCYEKNKWDRRTTYGKERFKFCAWCADELERKNVK